MNVNVKLNVDWMLGMVDGRQQVEKYGWKNADDKIWMEKRR